MNSNGNSLVNKTEELNATKYRVSILEANLTFFAIMIMTILSVFLLLPLNSRISIELCIFFAVLFLLFSIPVFIFAHKLSKERKIFKALFYLAFTFNAISVVFSVLAILNHYEINIKINTVLYLTATLLAFSLLDLLALTIGKRERLIFSLMGLIILGLIIFSFTLEFELTVPFVAYLCVTLFLHLSMLAYVFTGENFFVLMSLYYFIIAIVALFVALIIAGSGDCDLGGCDCGLSELGGRRKNSKLK